MPMSNLRPGPAHRFLPITAVSPPIHCSLHRAHCMSDIEGTESVTETPKAVSAKEPAPAKTAAEGNADWQDVHRMCLLNTLKEHRSELQSENGWKEAVWAHCEAALATKFPDAGGGRKTASKCSNQYTAVCFTRRAVLSLTLHRSRRTTKSSHFFVASLDLAGIASRSLSPPRLEFGMLWLWSVAILALFPVDSRRKSLASRSGRRSLS